jgi:hypothetical protein
MRASLACRPGHAHEAPLDGSTRFRQDGLSKNLLPKAVEGTAFWRDYPSMSATVIDKKRRMTLPELVCEAVGLKPNDQVEWRVEGGAFSF